MHAVPFLSKSVDPSMGKLVKVHPLHDDTSCESQGPSALIKRQKYNVVKNNKSDSRGDLNEMYF